MKYVKITLAILLSFLFFACLEDGMELIETIEVTDSVLDYSNIPVASDGHPEWTAGEVLDQWVVVGASSAPRLLVYSQSGDVLTLEAGVIDTLPTSEVFHMAKTQDNRHLFLTRYDGVLQVYERMANKLELRQTVQVSRSGNYSTGISYRNGFLIVSLVDEPFFVWFKFDEDDSLLTKLSTSPYHKKRATTSCSWISDNFCLLTWWSNADIIQTFFKRSGNKLAPVAGNPLSSSNAILALAVSDDPVFIAIGDYLTPHFSVFLQDETDLEAFALVYSEAGNSEPHDIRFSPSLEYIAVCGKTASPYVYIYKVEGVETADFSRLADPATQPTGQSRGLAWDETSTYLYAGSNIDGELIVYKRAADVFTALSTPAAGDDHSGSAMAILHFPASGYLKGDIVYDDNNLYESLIHDNRTDPADDDGTNWLDLGATNRWRMFDNYADTYSTGDATIDSGQIIARLVVNGIAGVYLGGLTAENVQVERLDSSNVQQWTTTKDVTGKEKIFVELDEATSGGGKVRVTISTNYALAVSVAIVQPTGTSTTLGKTEWGVENQPLDFSRKSTDDFGRTYLNPGRKADYLRASVRIDTGDYDMVGRALNSARAKNYVWNFNGADTDFESLIIFGFMSGVPRRVMSTLNDYVFRVEVQEFS